MKSSHSRTVLVLLVSIATALFATSCTTVEEPGALTERLRESSDIGKVKPRMQRRYR